MKDRPTLTYIHGRACCHSGISVTAWAGHQLPGPQERGRGRGCVLLNEATWRLARRFVCCQGGADSHLDSAPTPHPKGPAPRPRERTSARPGGGRLGGWGYGRSPAHARSHHVRSLVRPDGSQVARAEAVRPPERYQPRAPAHAPRPLGGGRVAKAAAVRPCAPCVSRYVPAKF